MIDLERLLALIAGGGLSLAVIAGIVWQLFKWFGAKWIDSRFEESLETFKHRQAQEIERLRGQIATLLDRATKLHQAEFETLPVIWELAAKTYGAAGSMVAAIQSYSDVKWLTPEELAQAMSAEFFTDHDRATVASLSGHERQTKFEQIVDVYKWRETNDNWMNFNNALVTRGIFIEPRIRAEFQKLANGLGDVIFDYRFEKFEGGGGPKKFTEIREAFVSVGETLNATRQMVSDRLWSEATDISFADRQSIRAAAQPAAPQPVQAQADRSG